MKTQNLKRRENVKTWKDKSESETREREIKTERWPDRSEPALGGGGGCVLSNRETACRNRGLQE